MSYDRQLSWKVRSAREPALTCNPMSEQSRTRLVLTVILCVAAALRLREASMAPLELIEKDEFIPGALTISTSHVPLRISQHGVLPMYLVRLSGLAFGDSPLGFRALSVVAGVLTVLTLFAIARRWWGARAGIGAAALLAVERYHVEVSARAIDLPWDLLFVCLSLYCFSRFVEGTERDRADWWLVGVAASAGLAFICKELSALLIPAFGAAMILTRRVGMVRWRVWAVAVGVLGVVVAPDVYANLATSPAERRALHDRHVSSAQQRGDTLPDAYAKGLFMSYGDHLSRFRGIGFNANAFLLYFGEAFDWLRIEYTNGFSEFPFMRAAMGILLWLGSLGSLLQRRRDDFKRSLAIVFAVMFLPFAVVRIGEPAEALPTDPSMLFYWVDRTMLPAILLTASWLGSAQPALHTRTLFASRTLRQWGSTAE